MSSVPPPPGTDDLTEQLRRWRDGDSGGFDAAFEAAYHHLHGLAEARLRHEQAGHTLNTTALVHEVYLRLAAARAIEWQDRRHFFAVASRAMRRILVDHARERRAARHGGGMQRVRFDPEELAGLLATDGPDPDALLALDDGLARLERENPRQARAVELRYFGELTLEEVGETLGVSAPTAMRDLRFGLAWLARTLCSATEAAEG